MGNYLSTNRHLLTMNAKNEVPKATSTKLPLRTKAISNPAHKPKHCGQLITISTHLSHLCFLAFNESQFLKGINILLSVMIKVSPNAANMFIGWGVKRYTQSSQQIYQNSRLICLEAKSPCNTLLGYLR